MDPIDYFPYEIFGKIIQLAAYDIPSGPLPFLTTSNRWLKTVVDISEAWTCIKIDNDPEVYHRTLAFLHLSRGRPIELQFSPKLCSTETLKLALKEASRIRVICIKNIDFQGDRPILSRGATLTNTVSLLNEEITGDILFPQLEGIVMERRDAAPKNLIMASPNLQRVINCVLWPALFHPMSSSVRDIEDHRFSEIKDLDPLYNPKKGFKFRTLHLDDISFSWFDDEEQDSVFPPLLLKVHKDSLEDLRITGSNSTSRLFNFLQYPPTRLQSLKITVPINMMHHFAASIPLFQDLKSLSLKCVEPSTQKQGQGQELPSPVVPLSHLRPSVRYFALDDPVDESNHPHLTSVANQLLTYVSFHNVYRMDFRFQEASFIHTVKLVPLLRAASSLHTLNFSFISYTTREGEEDGPDLSSVLDDPVNHLVLTNLEILKLQSVDPLRFIHAPNLVELYVNKMEQRPIHTSILVLNEGFGGNLKRLEIYCDSFAKLAESEQFTVSRAPSNMTFEYGVSTENGDGEDKVLWEGQHLKDLKDKNIWELEENKLSDLRQIVWKDWKTPCISFTAKLRSLTFIHLPQRWPDEPALYRNDPINALCYLLWKNKDVCSLLNTISSEVFPLWDLLFVTLRSRPRKWGDGSGVTALLLPCLPITPLLKRLVDLLNGKTRKDLIGASSIILQRMDKPYRPLDVCNACVCAGYTHCFDARAEPANPELEYDDFDNEELEHVVHLEPVFRSFSTHGNSDLLESLLDSDRLEYGDTCSRHRFKQLTTVDGTTLAGHD